MPSEKDRLYVALYARGGVPTMPGLEDTYHWALIVGPKTESENSRGSVWEYEERTISMATTSMLLVRIMVGKPEIPGWNCVEWVREAFLAAIQDGKALGTSASDWESVRDVMWYIEDKKAKHRFDGTVQYDPSKAATWDMLQGFELVP
ncbi:hypothetical protein F5Y09DRAFT_334430 [Xylaria sp. FL1042]|nr:hypothetical protein F5Y09DRAFT_334430 [Xylaria sp. FL1042]